jgi:hypothetical protein
VATRAEYRAVAAQRDYALLMSLRRRLGRAASVGGRPAVEALSPMTWRGC